MYADDVKMYKEVDKSGASSEVQAAMDFVEKWADEWELPLAVEKTHCFVVHPRCQPHFPIYRLKGIDLQQISEG